MYIRERKGWPEFTWDQQKVAALLAEARYLQGRFQGRMEALGFQLQSEASLQTLTRTLFKPRKLKARSWIRNKCAYRSGHQIGAGAFLVRHHPPFR